MTTIPLPRDFSEFLKLLAEHEVRYLLIGGYAVAHHGYVRGTADMDLWVDQAGGKPAEGSQRSGSIGLNRSLLLRKEAPES